jgi:hypothetical protein
MDIKSVIMEKHGSNCILAAQDGMGIIQDHQRALDNGEYDFAEGLYAFHTPFTWAVQDTYNTLLQSAKNRWLSQVTREQMMGMLSAMHAAHWGAAIEWLPGETMTEPLLMDAWNKANPDQEPIRRTPDWKI